MASRLAETTRERYGASPLHAIASIATFAFVAFVLVQVFGGFKPWGFVLWFLLAIVAHDLVGYPLYTLFDRIAQFGTGVEGPLVPEIPTINHLRIPAVFCGIMFLVWFPLILGLSDDRYEAATGMSSGVYLGRWLALTAAAFAISGAWYAVRLRRARRSPAAG